MPCAVRGGQTGGSLAPGTLASIPQSQRVTASGCGVVAAAEPAIMRKPNGKRLDVVDRAPPVVHRRSGGHDRLATCRERRHPVGRRLAAALAGRRGGAERGIRRVRVGRRAAEEGVVVGGAGPAGVDDRIIGGAMAERAVADEVDAAQLRQTRDWTARGRILARREAHGRDRCREAEEERDGDGGLPHVGKCRGRRGRLGGRFGDWTPARPCRSRCRFHSADGPDRVSRGLRRTLWFLTAATVTAALITGAAASRTSSPGSPGGGGAGEVAIFYYPWYGTVAARRRAGSTGSRTATTPPVAIASNWFPARGAVLVVGRGSRARADARDRLDRRPDRDRLVVGAGIGRGRPAAPRRPGRTRGRPQGCTPCRAVLRPHAGGHRRLSSVLSREFGHHRCLRLRLGVEPRQRVARCSMRSSPACGSSPTPAYPARRRRVGSRASTRMTSTSTTVLSFPADVRLRTAARAGLCALGRARVRRSAGRPGTRGSKPAQDGKRTTDVARGRSGLRRTWSRSRATTSGTRARGSSRPRQSEPRTLVQRGIGARPAAPPAAYLERTADWAQRYRGGRPLGRLVRRLVERGREPRRKVPTSGSSGSRRSKTRPRPRVAGRARSAAAAGTASTMSAGPSRRPRRARDDVRQLPGGAKLLDQRVGAGRGEQLVEERVHHARDARPANSATTRPSRKAFTAGMPLTENRCERPGWRRRRPDERDRAFARLDRGLEHRRERWQGPHQSAQKSTSTGRSADRSMTSVSNVSSVRPRAHRSPRDEDVRGAAGDQGRLDVLGRDAGERAVARSTSIVAHVVELEGARALRRPISSSSAVVRIPRRPV